MGILYLGELLTPTKKVRPIVELNQRKKINSQGGCDSVCFLRTRGYCVT